MKHHHIHREGRHAIIGLTLLIFIINVPIFIYAKHWIFALTLVLTALLLVFVTYFFRNPVRVLDVDDPKFIITPADGHVVVIEPVHEDEYFHDERLQVSIFMSPFNVHANWFPVEGEVVVSEHQKGRHRGAWLPKSSSENERSLVVIKMADGQEIAVRQVAGAMARRIVTYAKQDDDCYIDEHLGFIKFGSRVDLFIPKHFVVDASLQDVVRNSLTPIITILPLPANIETAESNALLLRIREVTKTTTLLPSISCLGRLCKAIRLATCPFLNCSKTLSRSATTSRATSFAVSSTVSTVLLAVYVFLQKPARRSPA